MGLIVLSWEFLAVFLGFEKDWDMEFLLECGFLFDFFGVQKRLGNAFCVDFLILLEIRIDLYMTFIFVSCVI